MQFCRDMERIALLPETSEQEIDEFEVLNSVRLPAPFKSLLMHGNGGYLAGRIYTFNYPEAIGEANVGAIEYVFGVSRQDATYSIGWAKKQLFPFRFTGPDSLWPMLIDDSDNLVCFDACKEGIYLWPNQIESLPLERKSTAEAKLICGSFEEFWSSLERWELSKTGPKTFVDFPGRESHDT
ncbi:MAG: SMI1/KNR4 family protein [Aureliella sp.]